MKYNIFSTTIQFFTLHPDAEYLDVQKLNIKPTCLLTNSVFKYTRIL